jgi:hypothetical protein
MILVEHSLFGGEHQLWFRWRSSYFRVAGLAGGRI